MLVERTRLHVYVAGLFCVPIFLAKRNTFGKKEGRRSCVKAFFVTFVCSSPRLPTSCYGACLGHGLPPRGFKTKARGDANLPAMVDCEPFKTTFRNKHGCGLWADDATNRSRQITLIHRE